MRTLKASLLGETGSNSRVSWPARDCMEGLPAGPPVPDGERDPLPLSLPLRDLGLLDEPPERPLAAVTTRWRRLGMFGGVGEDCIHMACHARSEGSMAAHMSRPRFFVDRNEYEL